MHVRRGDFRQDCPTAQLPAIEPRNGYTNVYLVDGRFDDVRAFVELVVTRRGAAINNVFRIGDMLRRIGQHIGVEKQLCAEVEALRFCGATAFCTVMGSNPRNIVFCPYILPIDALARVHAKVFVAYRRSPVPGNPVPRKVPRAVDLPARWNFVRGDWAIAGLSGALATAVMFCSGGIAHNE